MIYFHCRMNSKKDQLCGIVLCGGRSSRMGIDKSLLIYHSKPQRYHIYEMLSIVCAKVAISCNESQAGGMLPGYEFITDLPAFTGCGPIAGILSAFETTGNKDLLVIGCDYPFITMEAIHDFLAVIDYTKAAAFFNETTDHYEPMLAYYPAASYETLANRYANNQYSLQQFLFSVKATQHIPLDKNIITGVNSPQEYENARTVIHKINSGT